LAKTAIDAPRFDAFWIDPAKLTLVTDKASPFYQARAEEAPDAGLVLSMKSGGFLANQAISVFKDGDSLCVLDGRRRTIAAIEANRQRAAEGKELLRVSVILKRGTESELFAVQCSANENRADINDMERAKELSRLMGYGRTEEEAGSVLGMDKAKSKRVLSLLDCAAPVQKAVESGRLSASAASKLAKLPREEQVAQLDAALAEGAGKPTVAKVTRAVKVAQGESAVAPPSRKVLRATLKRAESDATGGDLLDVLRWVASGELDPESAFAKWLSAAAVPAKDAAEADLATAAQG